MILKRKNCGFIVILAASLIVLSGTVFADGWTEYASEENPPLVCPGNQLAAGMRCSGGNCDNISLYCRSTGNRTGSVVQWGPYRSEEQVNNICPNGMYTKGVDCSGGRCDNLSLLYYKVNNSNHNKCKWTGWFSEETTFDFNRKVAVGNSAVCPNGTYIVGITCKGDYCDNKQLLCCGF